MEVKCPQCQSLLRIADENTQRQARCPSCSAVFTPTAPSSTASHDASAVDAVSTSSTRTGPTSASASANPYAPTYSEPAVTQPGSSDWAPRLITVDEVLAKAWALFKHQWGKACMAIVIVGAINFVLSIIQNIVLGVMQEMVPQKPVYLVVAITIGLATQIVGIWLQIGQAMIMLDIARGRPVIISKLFGGGQYLLHSILASILLVLMAASIFFVFAGLPAVAFGLATQQVAAAVAAGVVGGVIAVVPLIVVFLMFSQFQMLIIDRRLGAIGALQTSYEITKGNKLMIFVIGIAVTVIAIVAAIAGLLALILGFIPAMIAVAAYAGLVMAVTYLCMTGQYVATPGNLAGPDQDAASP